MSTTDATPLNNLRTKKQFIAKCNRKDLIMKTERDLSHSSPTPPPTNENVNDCRALCLKHMGNGA
jgi:hypothetical protein